LVANYTNTPSNTTTSQTDLSNNNANNPLTTLNEHPASQIRHLTASHVSVTTLSALNEAEAEFLIILSASTNRLGEKVIS
jgi:hypothetical protein